MGTTLVCVDLADANTSGSCRSASLRQPRFKALTGVKSHGRTIISHEQSEPSLWKDNKRKMQSESPCHAARMALCGYYDVICPLELTIPVKHAIDMCEANGSSGLTDRSDSTAY